MTKEGVYFSLRKNKVETFDKLLQFRRVWKTGFKVWCVNWGRIGPLDGQPGIQWSYRHWHTKSGSLSTCVRFSIRGYWLPATPRHFTWNAAFCSVLSGSIFSILLFLLQLILKICKKGGKPRCVGFPLGRIFFHTQLDLPRNFWRNPIRAEIHSLHFTFTPLKCGGGVQRAHV